MTKRNISYIKRLFPEHTHTQTKSRRDKNDIKSLKCKKAKCLWLRRRNHCTKWISFIGKLLFWELNWFSKSSCLARAGWRFFVSVWLWLWKFCRFFDVFYGYQVSEHVTCVLKPFVVTPQWDRKQHARQLHATWTCHALHAVTRSDTQSYYPWQNAAPEKSSKNSS